MSALPLLPFVTVGVSPEGPVLFPESFDAVEDPDEFDEEPEVEPHAEKPRTIAKASSSASRPRERVDVVFMVFLSGCSRGLDALWNWSRLDVLGPERRGVIDPAFGGGSHAEPEAVAELWIVVEFGVDAGGFGANKSSGRERYRRELVFSRLCAGSGTGQHRAYCLMIVNAVAYGTRRDRMGATMYTMKQACELTGLSYETLKFYCRSELVPRVHRDARNHRVFDDHNIAWIRSLVCLRRCGLGIAEMKRCVALCLEGEASIPQRREILAEKREELQHRLQDIEDSIAYIDAKEQFYEAVLDGTTPYVSNVLGLEE